MGMEDDLLALIDLIYEASFDSTLWPMALTRLADSTGTAQVGLCAMDRRAHTYDSLAPRTDPVMTASYKNYWAFHKPLWTLSTTWPAGEVYLLDSLIPREDFAATPVFNEWFRPAKFGLAMMSANLLVGDRVPALIGVANAPGKDEIMREQMNVFKAALPHIDRAVRIHREDRLENLQRSVLLVDGAARVLFANAAARMLLGSGGALTLKAGCLHSTGRLGHHTRIDRLLLAQGPRAKWSRRRNFD